MSQKFQKPHVLYLDLVDMYVPPPLDVFRAVHPAERRVQQNPIIDHLNTLKDLHTALKYAPQEAVQDKPSLLTVKHRDNSHSNYPPMQILTRQDAEVPENSEIAVKFALAGWAKEEISVKFADEKEKEILLDVQPAQTGEQLPFSWKEVQSSFSKKEVHKTLVLADTVQLKGVEYRDGVLSLFFKNTVPGKVPPKEIQIN